MADRDDPENILRSIPDPRSQKIGDVPDTIKRRYYTEERGGHGLGFHVDAQVVIPAFRDQGREITAPRADPNAIRDMVEIAKHRGWRSIEVRGSPEFRREAWLAGRAAGLDMWGYRVADRDIQELERRTANHQKREVRQDGEAPERAKSRDGNRDDRRGAAQMRVVEAIVRSRVQDEEGQRRIVSNAMERIASWLERGASFSSPDQEPARGPDRRRSR